MTWFNILMAVVPIVILLWGVRWIVVGEKVKKAKALKTNEPIDPSLKKENKNGSDPKGWLGWLKELNDNTDKALTRWALINALTAFLLWDFYWAMLSSPIFFVGIQIAVVIYAANYGKKGWKWIHSLTTICVIFGLIFWAFGLEVEPQDEGPAKFKMNNAWAGWQDKEVEPAGLLDGVDTWWQRRQQDKAIAEAKAKEEVWPNRRLIKAPVTDNWEDTVEIQMPSRFKGCRVTGLEPNPDGLWEMSYKDVFGPVNTYVGGGAGIRKNPIITPNAKLRFRSLEKEPLNILVQWR